MPLTRQQIIVGSSLLAVVASAGIYWNSGSKPLPPKPKVADVAPKALLAEIAKFETKKTETIANAAASKRTSVIYTGNGREKLHLVAKNGGSQPLKVEVRAGDVFESGKNRVMLLHPFKVDVAPGKTADKDLETVAVASANDASEGSYAKVSTPSPKLEPLVRYLESHQELPVNVVQTVALALTEDAPVDLFAKFPRLQQSTSFGSTSTFKVETADIIAALQILNEIDAGKTTLAGDSQLKIEAMMDPVSHDAAMKYYGIAKDEEWSYWKHELLEGEPSTRHYALYGIARFHPDVALQMMPTWVREKRTSQIYRLAALGALALTHREEAEPILKSLQQEFVQETDVSQSSDQALRYLAASLNHSM